VIGNGVDLSLMRELPPAANDRPHVTFVGSVHQRWHGVDKIVSLARDLPDVRFHLVGAAAGDVDAAPENIVFHGALSREEYECVLGQCDAGFGTLALHRTGMHEASPLKVREYLGYGLPVVLAHEDTDFPDCGAWYLLRLPNEESNLRDHVPEIRSFLERVRGRRVPRAEVEEQVGAHVKERSRLDFFRQLLT
jgi:glycosyltransferase involved in cell wall biosynthesis